MTNSGNRILLRVSEVAEACGMSRSKAYELVAKGLLPAIRIDGMLRIPASALRELAERAERGTQGTEGDQP